MKKRFLPLLLIVSLLNLMAAQATYASSKEEKDAKFAEKVMVGIEKLGTGEQARVEVKLKDKRKLKGYIREAGAENFVVVDPKTGDETTVSYPQVKQVKGKNLSAGAKIAIGLGALAAVL